MRRANEVRIGATRAVIVAAALTSAGCGSKTPPTSPPCDEGCRDGVALRALRETMKFAYNKTVQGSPVGPQDAGTNEFLAGTARVFGEATSDPLQGTTNVDLTYVFANTNYLQKNDMPAQNYNVVIDGTVTQAGILAVQPSSTTALLIRGTDLRIVGTVYDPPIDYAESGCAVEVTQNGNNVSGNFCGRMAGFNF